ncbi:MAG: CopG family antitoxin [Nocardiopsaceae bacterium]|nr:CopG family antitoxin [Nocardiopsaceae bacterium]
MPLDELEKLADHYDTHDIAAEMEEGEWVEPRPMATTSLRLPVEVIERLKEEASREGVRYTALIRTLLERHVKGMDVELVDIRDRLERIERELKRDPAA